MNLLKNMDVDKFFGNEDGQDEQIEFLRDVYIKSGVYKKAISDDRIVCVRSRKGVGKSALITMAVQEIEGRGIPTLSLTPTDLAISSSETDYNVIVDKFKKRLARLCVGKLAERIGFAATSTTQDALAWAEKDGFATRDFIADVARTFQQAAKAKMEEKTSSDEAVARLLTRLSEGKSLVVFIDDFDRGWTPKGPEATRIKALITALREIAKESNSINFRIAIREDVWQYLELTDEQIDKFRQYAHVLHCDDKTLIAILARRIWYNITQLDSSYRQPKDQNLTHFYELFERQYRWNTEIKQMHEVITKLSRNRPRDIIQLAKGAATRAILKKIQKISQDEINEEDVQRYSKTRVSDLCKEFKNECPEIEQLINVFGGNNQSFVFPYVDIMKLIKSVNGRFPIEIFGKRATDLECLAFLYRSGFVSAREQKNETDYDHREYEEYPSLVDANVGIDKFEWEIHPAFRHHLRGLQVSKPLQRRSKR